MHVAAARFTNHNHQWTNNGGRTEKFLSLTFPYARNDWSSMRLSASSSPGTLLLHLLAIAGLASFMLLITWDNHTMLPIESTAWATEQWGRGADPSRFRLQAEWLKDGYGYREVQAEGSYCTSLPPGYPVILSGLLLITDDIEAIRVMQGCLLVIVGLLIFMTSRRIFPLLAYPITGCILISPWMTAITTLIMSESFGIIVSCLLALSLCRALQFRDRGVWPIMAAFLCSVLTFVSTGLAPVCLGVVLSLTWEYRTNRRIMASCLLAAGIPMLLWQFHCINATGTPAVTLLKELNVPSASAYRSWMRTWAGSVEDYFLYLGPIEWTEPMDFSRLPARAFDSAEQQEKLISLSWRMAEDGVTASERAQISNEIRRWMVESSARRSQADFFRCSVTLPLARAVDAVTGMHQPSNTGTGLVQSTMLARLLPNVFWREVKEFGILRATFRACGGGYAATAFLMFYMTRALVLTGIIYGLASRRAVPIAIVFGTLAFFFVHGYLGPEFRRSLPAFPLIIMVPIITRCYRQHDEAGHTTDLSSADSEE